MRSKLLIMAVLFALLVVPVFAQSSEQYRFNTLKAQYEFQAREQAKPSRVKFATRTLPEVPELFLTPEVTPQTDVLIVGDWRRGLSAVADTDGDNEIDGITFFLKRKNLLTASIAVSKGRIYASTLDGRLLLMGTDRGNFKEFIGLTMGDALLPVPQTSQIWMGNNGFSQVMQYVLEPFISMPGFFPEGKVSIASRDFLPSILGEGAIEFVLAGNGDVYALTQGQDDTGFFSGMTTLWRIPGSPTGPQASKAVPISSVPYATSLAVDGDTVFILTAEVYVDGPGLPGVGTGVEGGGGGYIPSTIMSVTNPQAGKPVVFTNVWTGGSLRTFFGAANGIAARHGKLYVISHSEQEGSEVLLIYLGKDGHGEFMSRYAPANLLGGTTLSGLAFLN